MSVLEAARARATAKAEKAKAAKKKERAKAAKKPVRLLDADKEEIKSLYKTGKHTVRTLATKYNVSHTLINQVVKEIDKGLQSDIITRESKALCKKVLETPNLSITDKTAIIKEIGHELTNFEVVNKAAHVLINRVINEGAICEPQHLKDFAATAKTAGQMLGVETCSNAPKIVNTNAQQNIIETVYKYEVIE